MKQGFAIKQSPIPMGHVRFKINIYGARYLEVYWTETLIMISRQKDLLEKILTYIEHRLTNTHPNDNEIIIKALAEINIQKNALIYLREEYGLAIGDSWYNNTLKRIEWLEARFKGLREIQSSTETQSSRIHS